MTDVGPGQETVQFPWAPVPTQFQVTAAKMGAQAVVIVIIKTPDNQSTTFWEPDALIQMAEKAKAAARMAKSGLILPQSNGVGEAVDLSAYRDEKVEVVEDVEETEEDDAPQ